MVFSITPTIESQGTIAAPTISTGHASVSRTRAGITLQAGECDGDERLHFPKSRVACMRTLGLDARILT
eukprot:6180083-Pleurochrysis_carterae.AAC.1